jgi:putative transposase
MGAAVPLDCVPRMPRVVAPELPHHVTQRGNYRQQVFFSKQDRRFFLDRLAAQASRHRLDVLGWCLMPNHFHLIAVPRQTESLALTLRPLLSEYSMRMNVIHKHLRGHLWQSRFYSCVLEENHLWRALRYVELNPVRASLVERAIQYEWSTARYHAGAEPAPTCLDLSLWRSRFSSEDWAVVLEDAEGTADEDDLRRCTRVGRPWGDAAFLRQLEDRLGRRLEANPVGHPRREPAVRQAGPASTATAQGQFDFAGK